MGVRSRRRLTDTTPWIDADRPAPEPVRDELYEAWKRLDPRHTGVMARHAWNAAWEAARNYFKETSCENAGCRCPDGSNCTK